MLNVEQTIQLKKQLEHHNHETYFVDIDFTKFVLKNFVVFKYIMRPEIMVSKYFAEHLANSPRSFLQNKSVVDLGCGSGLQGLISAFKSANYVTFADIDQRAVDNAQTNYLIQKDNLFYVRNNNSFPMYPNDFLMAKTNFIQSDLLLNLDHKKIGYDIILFNHPFVPATREEIKLDKDYPVLTSMLGGDHLIHRFFDQAREIPNKELIVIMPYLHLFGDTNNPEIQGKKHGFKIEEKERFIVHTGIQRGELSFYYLTK